MIRLKYFIHIIGEYKETPETTHPRSRCRSVPDISVVIRALYSVSLGFCRKTKQNKKNGKKQTQSRLLKTREIDSLTVLVVRRLISRSRWSWLLLEVLGENLFHSSLLASTGSCQSLAFIGLQLHHSYLCLWYPAALSLCVSVSLCLT